MSSGIHPNERHMRTLLHSRNHVLDVALDSVEEVVDHGEDDEHLLHPRAKNNMDHR